MNRKLLKQFLIALALFLLGYFSFNHNLFAAENYSSIPQQTGLPGLLSGQ